MILVTGATGNIGSEVLRQALASRTQLRILARTPSKLAGIQGTAEVVEGDLTRPETLKRAFDGVARAFLVFAAGEALPEISRAAFDVARQSGVRHVTLVSSSTVLFEPSVAIGRWHAAAEESLKATGMTWSMLRPGNFASNALRWTASLRATGQVFVPNPAQGSAPIDPADIGAAAAKTLLSSGHEGKAYTLTGPQHLTVSEQVATIAAVTGKPYRCTPVSVETARGQMMKFGMDAVMVDAVLELMSAPREGGSSLLTNTVSEVTGAPARTFEAWVRSNAVAFS